MPLDFGYPWMPDNGDGTYRNPVIHADYSDPDIIRHGADYWLTASSFNCTPGLPILHSRDLVNWTLVNHAIQQVPHPRYSEVQPGCGVWAPSLRFHAGKFWIFFPMPDEGIFVTVADDPRGTWSEPWLLQEAKGWIDPCPFWDDDGRAYLVHAYANSRAGKRDRIHVRPMSPDGRRLLGEGCEVIHAPHHPYLEGPKMHKREGWYYILAPGGGVTTGWQVAFRARRILGPYEEKIVLERGSTGINGPHQGALVDAPDDGWWFLHFQDCGPFGRIVHLQPVVWKSDWPFMGRDYDGNGIGEPVPAWSKPGLLMSADAAMPVTTDEFEAIRLGLQWQWQANHDAAWASLTERPGWLALTCVPRGQLDLGLLPNFLGQKFPARSFLVETQLDFSRGRNGCVAGLAIVGGKTHGALAVRHRQGGADWVLIENGCVEVLFPAVSPLTRLRLRVRVATDGSCGFALRNSGGAWIGLSRTFHASEGGWIGARVGLFAIASDDDDGAASARANFGFFRFSG